MKTKSTLVYSFIAMNFFLGCAKTYAQGVNVKDSFYVERKNSFYYRQIPPLVSHGFQVNQLGHYEFL